MHPCRARPKFHNPFRQPCIIRPDPSRMLKTLAIGAILVAACTASAQIARPRRATTTTTTAPVSQPAEEPSPPAEGVQRRPTGYIGGPQRRQVTGSSDFL